MGSPTEGLLLSICVCTHNRAALLPRALNALVPGLDPARVEVLVVENGSEDASTIAGGFAAQSTAVRYVHEPKIGLSNARNRGWREARGVYVGYLDDDAVPRAGWVTTALDLAGEMRFDAFGGPYFAYYDSPTPPWYREEYSSHWQGDVARALNSTEYLDGTNMFVRRQLLEQIGGFDAQLGMRGDTLSYGEETELQNRLRAAKTGASIYYDPRLVVDHLVPAHKMTLRWIAKSAVVEGRVNRVLFETSSRRGWRQRALRALAGLAAAYTVGVLVRDRARYQFAGEYLYECTLTRCRELGAALQQRRDRGSDG